MTKIHNFGKLAVFLAIAGLADVSALADVACTGTVTDVRLEAEGLLEVDTGFGLYQLCWMGTVTPVSMKYYGSRNLSVTYCQALAASLLTSKSTGKDVVLFFGAATCPTTLTAEYPYSIIFK